MRFFRIRKQTHERSATGERIILGNLPIYHAFGICVFLTCALEGESKIVLLPRFTEESYLSSIQVI